VYRPKPIGRIYFVSFRERTPSVTVKDVLHMFREMDFGLSCAMCFFLLLLAHQRIRGFACMRYINPRLID